MPTNRNANTVRMRASTKVLAMDIATGENMPLVQVFENALIDYWRKLKYDEYDLRAILKKDGMIL